MKIAIVNDLALAVASIRRVLASVPSHQVIWTAADGVEACERCRQEQPDLILMDLIMPRLNGAEATRRIMASNPCAILVVTSSVEDHAALVFAALGAGALDAVNTPDLEREPAASTHPLLRKIEVIQQLIAPPAPSFETETRASSGPPAAALQAPLIVLGASAGGPAALARLLGALKPEFPAALVVIQHLDAAFTTGFAHWLSSQCRLPVKIAETGMLPVLGTVLIAGGDDHLTMTATGRLAYTQEPRACAYRPSVDVFFRSVARYWRAQVIGVVLTGMGRDGASGLKSLRDAGAVTLAQSRDSSAVFGMPKAAIETGAAMEILGLEEMSARFVHLLAGKSHLRR